MLHQKDLPKRWALLGSLKPALEVLSVSLATEAWLWCHYSHWSYRMEIVPDCNWQDHLPPVTHCSVRGKHIKLQRLCLRFRYILDCILQRSYAAMIFPSPQNSRRYALKSSQPEMETMSDFRPWKRNLLSKMPYPTVTQPYSERFATIGIHLKGCTEQAKMYAPKHISSKVWGVGVGALLFGNLQVTNLRNLSFRAPPPGRLVQLLRAIAQSRTCSSLTQIPHPPLAEAAVPAREGANTTVSKPWELDIVVNPRICIQKIEVYP